MFRIEESEAKMIEKLAPKNRLVRTGKKTKCLVMDDDHVSLRILSQLRGKSVSEILRDEYQ